MRLIGRGAPRRLALVVVGMAVAAHVALAGSVGARNEDRPRAVTASAPGNPATAVEAVALAEALARSGPFTVFAPTEDGLVAVSGTDLHRLLADGATLAVVATDIAASDTAASDGVIRVLDR